MRSFVLRQAGIVGDVGEGCEFTSGQTVICWRGHHPHIDVWPYLADAKLDLPIDIELIWSD